ncbi:MAG: beta-lactamase family protein [Akkermansia sp.]|nr:beta-lactamase family protein [Akkermansia sp.]
MQLEWAGEFERCFRENLAGGASVSVWKHGLEILTLSGGEGWSKDTLVPIFSATKPASALCLLLALHDCCRGPELEVGDIWPAFPAPHCTVGQLLSHQCGLAALAESAPLEDLAACRDAIEKTSPAWLPPQHGYHPQTFGPLVDILLLELTGMRVCEFWEQRIRRPLGLDFYIGLPECEFHRVAQLQAPRIQPGYMQKDEFYKKYFDTGSSVYRAFHSIVGYGTPREMSAPAAWRCGSPAKGGVASARGLAQFYQCLLADFIPTEVRDWLATPQCSGWDNTLQQHTAFTCGAMCEPAYLFPGGGFGHAGAGGSHAFCAPDSGLSFAFVMNRMELGNLPGARVERLLQLLSTGAIA